MRKTFMWALMALLFLTLTTFAFAAAPADISVTAPATIANNSATDNASAAIHSNTGAMTAVAHFVNGKMQVSYTTSMPMIAATNPCIANTLNVSIASKDSKAVPVTDAKATDLNFNFIFIAETYDSTANAAVTDSLNFTISATGNFADNGQFSASSPMGATYAHLVLLHPENEPRFPTTT